MSNQVSKYRSDTGCPDVAALIEPRFFRALCDPNRIAILVRLARCGRPCTVTEIASCCTVNISVVSRHLAMLREAGILEAEKRGKEVFYAVRFGEIVSTLRALADAIDQCCPGEANRPDGCCAQSVVAGPRAHAILHGEPPRKQKARAKREYPGKRS